MWQSRRPDIRTLYLRIRYRASHVRTRRKPDRDSQKARDGGRKVAPTAPRMVEPDPHGGYRAATPVEVEPTDFLQFFELSTTCFKYHWEGVVGKLLVAGGVAPALFFGLAWLLNWTIIPGASSPTVSDIWAIVGCLLGYWGVLFSGYAAYQVKQISEKYFARTRFPQIKANLDTITKDMGKAGDKPASALRGEKFIALIAVSLGEVERVPGHKMSDLIKRAKAEKKTLIDWINEDENKSVLANTEPKFWDLFRTMHEISEGILAHMKEQGAR